MEKDCEVNRKITIAGNNESSEKEKEKIDRRNKEK